LNREIRRITEMTAIVCISIGVYAVCRAVELVVSAIIRKHREHVEKDVARLVMLLSEFKEVVE
jgi:hypothetical protein